ncbi:membrane protein [Pseudorhodoferax aquiterrae]|uniref:Membrane protein n=1 Tax=Pseudorhodoferax aquiterrae TaxID=747304 RepID=A0ABQ3GF46_9BURK|nr:Mpo1-like protein [Pseudorhodoferax aquiterrae]GHD04082.1 membrane protein [Pseudorhodoferax aquiterrae]
MRKLVDQLSQYAAYHRDRRNIATHFIGIPMIVQAVAVLLARPVLVEAGPAAVSAATLVTLATALYYLWLDVRLGAVMAVLLGLALWCAQVLAAQPTPVWLGWGLGLFVVGWLIQFVGHWWEGRKPAFVDDLVGLVIGPLFVLAELAFLLGLRRELQQQIEARVGPVRGAAVAA